MFMDSTKNCKGISHYFCIVNVHYVQLKKNLKKNESQLPSLVSIVAYYAKSGGTVRSVDGESQATSVCV